ncbi:hypothetical protein HUG17_0132 [Dermatophagoides farinae]|uniref:Chitin-binding type-2 domain-containing protein n=1 Tax=Dermatophagoides farinae TaxID=6954 RepID=A0A9D4P5E0_DERFA|nr:hypothetical protein HUG17_0132 [Dermatophagoides farinae]
MSESKLRLTKLIPSSTTTTVTNHSRKTTELIGGKHSFLCPNGTIFSQEYLICDWWYNVKCDESPRFYPLNRDVYASGLNLGINGANHNHHNNNNDHQQQQNRDQQPQPSMINSRKISIATTNEQQQQQQQQQKIHDNDQGYIIIIYANHIYSLIRSI